MIVPQEIRNRRFERGFNGYHQEEVTAFLEAVAGEYEELYSQNQRLQDKLRHVRSQIEILKETEGKLDQVLDLSREKASELEKETEVEVGLLLDNTYARVSETLLCFQELVQRINAYSTEAKSFFLRTQAFYEEELLCSEVSSVPEEDSVIEHLRVEVNNLLEELNLYKEAIGQAAPVVPRQDSSIESLMAPMWGKILPTKKIDNKVINSTYPEVSKPSQQTENKVIPPVLLDEVRPVNSPVQTTSSAEMFWEGPPIRKKKNGRLVWTIILVLVMILGMVAGYLWSSGLYPGSS